jgi:hypothetical protein
LKTLLIAGCAPNEIPSWVFKLRSLTQLDVEGNQIKFLPRELEELTLLTDLDISHNPITTIFFDVDKMRYLQSVYISIDQFTMLPFLFLSKVGAKLKIVDGKGQPIKKYRL